LFFLKWAAKLSSARFEIVVKSFEFVPLGPPQPAVLPSVTRLPGGQVHFGIAGQFDRRYLVQGSTNLVSWQDLATLLATNTVIEFAYTNSGAAEQRFFRAVTLP